MSATADRTQVLVGGAWETPTQGGLFKMVSPHSEEPWAYAAAAGREDVDRAVIAARSAFDSGPWPRLSPAERIAALRRLAVAFGERRGEMAELISREMGAPITFAKQAHVRLRLAMITAFCDIAEHVLWEDHRNGAFGGEVTVRKEPVGVVGAIVPWNMPQFLIVTKLVPALLAGCCVIVKPSPETALDALLLAEIVADPDLPRGVVSVIPGGPEVGEHLISHAGVDKVSNGHRWHQSGLQHGPHSTIRWGQGQWIWS